ncbi:MAG: hypothetical protein H0X24_00140 [Ktedonobacterales bacterium]|nr:hypothetical protein [Ktedonobacterales bacterium]
MPVTWIQRGAHQPRTLSCAARVGDFHVECIAEPRQVIFKDVVTGQRTFQPLSPSQLQLMLLLLHRFASDQLAPFFFITVEEAAACIYPTEAIHLDNATRRRIGRQIIRLKELINPYITLIHIHHGHQNVGYYITVTMPLGNDAPPTFPTSRE